MFIQIFRNKLSQNWELKKKIKNLEVVIRTNINQPEHHIVKEIAKEWNKQRRINLKPFGLGGNFYYLWIDFSQWPTHGYPINVTDTVELDSDKLEYPTEYGDIAIVVDYSLDNCRITRKVSILQTKKEKRQNEVDIALHQLYLMHCWPNVEFPTGTMYKFKGVNSDEFSFYHFILSHSANLQFSSSICSAPMVSNLLGTNANGLKSKLKAWLVGRKTNPKLPHPSIPLRSSLLPGAIFQTSNRYKWNLVPKSFERFLYDSAYLFVGTDNEDVLNLTQARISTILAMQVSASREKQEVGERSRKEE